MAKQPHSMSLDDEVYNRFREQSHKRGTSITKRVEEFMKKELGDKDDIRKH